MKYNFRLLIIRIPVFKVFLLKGGFGKPVKGLVSSKEMR